jgi:hypothetical protein
MRSQLKKFTAGHPGHGESMDRDVSWPIPKIARNCRTMKLAFAKSVRGGAIEVGLTIIGQVVD